MSKKITLSTLFLAFLFQVLPAQSPVLVKDLFTGTDDGFDQWNYTPIRLGNKLVIPANDGNTGLEVFVIENEQITLLKDIFPGTTSSIPSYFTLLNGKAYFAANDGSNGNELWETDGTANGTVMVADLAPGAAGINPTGLIADASGNLYFAGSDEKLWVREAATGNISKVTGPVNVDFSQDYNSTSWRTCLYDGGIAFAVFNNQNLELWTVKGTVASMVYSQNVASNWAKAIHLAPVSNGIVFTVDDSFNTQFLGLYAYNASTGTTTRIIDGNVFANQVPVRMFSLNAQKAVYMGGSKFFVTDGTTAGTTPILDGVPDIYQGYALPHAIWQGKMLFSSDNPSFSERVAITDGTAAGTSTVLTAGESFISNIVNDQQHAFWAAGTSNGFQPEIWYTNISTGVSAKLYGYTQGSNDGPTILMVGRLGTKLYFISNMGGVGRELYTITTPSSSDTQESALQDNTPAYKVVRHGASRQFIVENNGNAEQIQIQLFSQSGQLLFSGQVMSDSRFQVPVTGNLDILTVSGKNGRVSVKVL